MRVLTLVVTLSIVFSAFAETELDFKQLEGKWLCNQLFNLTDSIQFKASHTSYYSFADNTVISMGSITTSTIDNPEVKSILAVTYNSQFSLDGSSITFEPQDIEANVQQNDLGDLSEEFVKSFKAHKVKSSAIIDILNNNELQLSFSNGTKTQCLRK